jgi:(+)-neomenthol dehydrogenase
VVTGGNKGIGFEICKQLASEGIMVVLTARDEKKGIESLESLKSSGLSENLFFHQLDVADASTIATLFHFIKSNFGKLDILVNNAGISGIMLEGDISLLENTIVRDINLCLGSGDHEQRTESKANGKFIETHELAESCLQTNYYGAKRMTEAFIPLLQLSPSSTIVNVSSVLGTLKLLSNEWAKGVLGDVESLTEERVDEVVNEFLEDFKDGKVKAKGWPSEIAAYKVSKSSLNAYTRVIAKKYPSLKINCLCPGYAKTDITGHTGFFTAAEAAENCVKLALLDSDGPSGLYFYQKEVTTF